MKKILIVILLVGSSLAMNAQLAASISLWKDSVMGAIWNEATQTVAYGKPDSNGYYKIYLSDSLGNNETPLTYSGWQTDRHQWAEEWDPTGQYLICYVEKSAYVWESDHIRLPQDAIPGYGAYTDIWLLKRDGSQAWQLTNFPNDYSNGVIHGAISLDGTMFAWTERTQAPVAFDWNLLAGGYVFRVADISYSPTPSLSNIRTFEPNNVPQGGEVESFSTDNSKIAIYSTFESQNIVATPLYSIDIASGQITRLTTVSFSQCPTYVPDGQHMIYMTGNNCDIFPLQLQGADWWMMNNDSTNKQRLTYMNVTGHPQCVNQYRLAGSLSFMSNTSFLGGVMTQSLGLTGHTVKVDFSNMVSVKEEDHAPVHFSVLPNPSQDHITLLSDQLANDFVVRIFDLSGRELIRVNNQNTISIGQLDAGSYLVELRQGLKRGTQLVVKQ